MYICVYTQRKDDGIRDNLFVIKDRIDKPSSPHKWCTEVKTFPWNSIQSDNNDNCI